MKREELLSQARKHLWAAWALSAEELASQAAATLLGLGMLVPEGGAAELEQLAETVQDVHVKYSDSDHCQHDGELWPCPTAAALPSEADEPGSGDQ